MQRYKVYPGVACYHREGGLPHADQDLRHDDVGKAQRPQLRRPVIHSGIKQTKNGLERTRYGDHSQLAIEKRHQSWDEYDMHQ